MDCACRRERMYCFDCWAFDGEKHCQWCIDQQERAAEMAKRRKSKREGAAIKKLGKITFVYFNGDVGDFLESLSKELQKPTTKAHFKELFTAILAASQVTGNVDVEFRPPGPVPPPRRSARAARTKVSQ
jgi:hypothetical protein